jgi:hypothetical protein
MEGLVHSDTHINFAIHGEDRESEINIEGGEVEAQEININFAIHGEDRESEAGNDEIGR